MLCCYYYNWVVLVWRINRCSCKQCEMMPTPGENICCHTYSDIRQRLVAPATQCITETAMYRDNCLNRNVLETSRHEYIYHHGPFGDAELDNECVQLIFNIMSYCLFSFSNTCLDTYIIVSIVLIITRENWLSKAWRYVWPMQIITTIFM
jgi:hypothetical protein